MDKENRLSGQKKLSQLKRRTFREVKKEYFDIIKHIEICSGCSLQY